MTSDVRDNASPEGIAACMGGVSVANLACLPDFLVVAPPRTGTTWLAANLARHPEIFATENPKELKYFSDHWRSEDLNWYLNHFQPGVGKVKGEASPSYSILPGRMIEVIRAIVPRVKLIFLMRDPVERAWSHVKHAYAEREATFRGYDGPFESIPEATLLESFTHEWMLASGDYLGSLQRWTAVFPKSQFFVGFYESIGRDPTALLRELFTFLGVTPDVAWQTLPHADVIHPGRTVPVPARLRAALQAVYAERTDQLVRYLDDRWDLDPPAEWSSTRTACDQAGRGSAPLSKVMTSFTAGVDDDALDLILQRQVVPLPPRLVVEGHKGFNVAKYRGRLYAVPQALGPIPFCQLGEAGLQFLKRAASAESLPRLLRLIEAMDAAAAGTAALSADERADLDGELSDVVRTAREAAEAERRTAEAERAKAAAAARQLTTVEAEGLALRRRIEGLTVQVTEAGLREKASESALQALTASKEAVESSLRAKTHRLTLGEAELTAARAQLTELQRQVQAERAKYEAAATEAQSRTEQMAQLERDGAALRGALDNLEAEVSELHAWIDRLQNELVTMARRPSWWTGIAGRRRR
jgi:hypothetical protein